MNYALDSRETQVITLDRIEKKVDSLDGLPDKTSAIRTDVDSIKGGFSKIMWIVLGTLAVAVFTFVAKGGLNIH